MAYLSSVVEMSEIVFADGCGWGGIFAATIEPVVDRHSNDED
jgi:hypothetical protein